MDFFDADIEERLKELEAEEARLEATGAYAPEEDDEDELDEEEKLLYEIIKDKQAIARHKNHETKTNVPKKFTVRGRTEASVREQLETVGLESDGVVKSTMGGKKRNRSLSRASEKEADKQPARAPRSESVRGRGTLSSDSVIRGESASEMRGRSVSRDKHHRSQSATRGPTTGMPCSSSISTSSLLHNLSEYCHFLHHTSFLPSILRIFSFSLPFR